MGGQCIVSVGGLTKSIFKAAKRLVTVKENCAGDNDDKHCAHNALKIVASLASMGDYLAGAVGRCTANTPANAKMKADAQCASESTHLVAALHRMASSGIAMKTNCME